MGVLIPTPVTKADLADIASPINVIDPAAAQAVSPRFTHTDFVTVAVSDDGGKYWTQKHLGGEWIRGGRNTGNSKAGDIIVPAVVEAP